MDARGVGAANHRYCIALNDTNPLSTITSDGKDLTYVDFQNGPLQEVGVNGVTQEALLAIVIDRLKGFQSGVYACEENAQALIKCQEALLWLHKRTLDREKRGVEGARAL